LCIYILSERTSEECAKDFTKFGGLRTVKRWLLLAEENERVTESLFSAFFAKQAPESRTVSKQPGMFTI